MVKGTVIVLIVCTVKIKWKKAWKLQNRTAPGLPLLVPDGPIYGPGPQPGGPSMGLNFRSYGERLAKEAFWLPATRSSKKVSGRAITPATEAVQGPRKPSSCATFTSALSCHRRRKALRLRTQVASVVSSSLRPCGLWPARLLCRGGSAGKNTRAYWPILVAIPY